MNFNKAIIVGNLTRDPEARSMPNGQQVVNFGIASNRYYNDQQGNRQEKTEFHNIVAFGKLADICSKYLKKGTLVLVEGRLQTNNWEGKDGVKRYRTEIIMESMQMGPRRDGSGEQNYQNQTQEAPMQNRDPDPKGVGEIPVIEAEETIEENQAPEKAPMQDRDPDPKGVGEKVDIKDIPF